MDFSLSEEQDATQQLAAEILTGGTDFERLRAIEDGPDAPGVDVDLWKELAKSNLLGVAVAETHGGSAFGFFALTLLLEQAGRTLAPVPLHATLILGALPIEAFGSEEQKKTLLEGVVSGDVILTAALGEIGATGFSRTPRTRTQRRGEGFVIDGEKICVPYAGHARRMLVSASGDEGTTVFLVDPGADGVRLERLDTTGHEPQWNVKLEDVAVASEDVLGEVGGGARLLDWLEIRASLGYSALQLGVAEEALRITAEYTGTRKQFGKPIGAFQAVSLRAADGYVDIECMRSTLWQAAWRLESGLPSAKETAAARWWACRGGHRVVHAAQHLHGGTGADVDYPIHRYFLKSKQLGFALGGASETLDGLGAMLAAEAFEGAPLEGEA